MARLLLARDDRMTGTLELTSYEYITGVAEALRQDFGESASTVKEICERTGAAPGTVKRWLALENGPNGEMLLKVAFVSPAVRRFLDSTLKREDSIAEQERRLKRALAILEGRVDVQ
jgi:transcriptional regulator with XRE-family HTH domain